ncbi:MAG: cyclic nucleotide-binding domain-containing protein [Verrucomicrobiota bacterium]
MPELPQVSWVAHLKPDDIELLSSYGEFLPAHEGQTVITEGTRQDNLFVLISGRLTVKRKSDLGELTITTIQPGEIFGEVSVFDPGLASASVVSDEFSQVWRISRDDVFYFMQDNPVAGNQMMVGLATTLAQRLRATDPLTGAIGNNPLQNE